MCCVFLETGNDKFLSHITDTFCEKIVLSIIDLYKNGAFTGPNGVFEDEKTKDLLKNEKKVLFFINCNQFPDIPCCDKEGCNINHITALAKNQLDILSDSFTTKKNFFSKNCGLDHKQQICIQRVFNAYMIANKNEIEEIKIPQTKDHPEYLGIYIKKTNLLKKKAKKFFYVKDKVTSDYDYFKNHTRLPNVKDCCAL
ncbi:MAG: hypothetical protein LBB72_07850 [Spirochaetaceae bacterium]|jgi:hypothetical protein|nr:hypothetical protein [Spirochaetaceae bacterium]